MPLILGMIKNFQFYVDTITRSGLSAEKYSTEWALYNANYSRDTSTDNTVLLPGPLADIKNIARKLDVESYDIFDINAANKFTEVTGNKLENKYKLYYDKIVFCDLVSRPAEYNDSIGRNIELNECAKFLKTNTLLVLRIIDTLVQTKFSYNMYRLPQLKEISSGIYINEIDSTIEHKYRLWFNDRMLVERYFPLLPDKKMLMEEVAINCASINEASVKIESDKLEFKKICIDKSCHYPNTNQFTIHIQ